METVRTRFAPSPTGFLHVGGARTALYSWLFARKHQGAFILRIEDTDRERSTKESIQAILDGMDWLGLDYDEGPFYQTDRFDRYKEVIQQLLDEDHAYYCTCSKERLEKMRADQLTRKEKPRYDGHCRDAKHTGKNGSSVVRFRNPEKGEVIIDDQVYGQIRIKNSELDDLIIARSSGVPTYNLTVVVDDFDMKITHVIRGDDHVNNTPRQINILNALGVTPPVYAHLPMILGPDGKRLSKRHGAVSVLQYREEGYLPKALLNYLVRLGWSYGDQEIFSIEEMIKFFDLNALSKSAAAFNPEKLNWLNQHYIKTSSVNKTEEALRWQFKEADIDIEGGPSLKEIIEAQAERCKTLSEMVQKSRFFYEEVTTYDEAAVKKNFTQEEVTEILTVIHDTLKELGDDGWDAEAIHYAITSTAEEFDLKLGKVAQPIRVAVSGGSVSPPIDITLYLLGREKVLARLKAAIAFIKTL